MSKSSVEATFERDWAVIREEYEGKQFLPKVICKRYGITAAQLRHRRQKEGWPPIRARAPRQDELVTRMLKVLDKQIRQLEEAVSEPIDKQAKVLADSIRSMEKLIEMGAAKPNVEPPTRKDMTDLREKLARRIEQFNRR